MLPYIIFIVITAVLFALICVFGDCTVSAAVSCALIGFMIFMTFGLTVFYFSAAAFAIVHGTRIALKLAVKDKYEVSFPESRRGLKQAFSALGISAALLFAVYVGKSRIQGLTYDFKCFELAFFASLGAAFAVSVSCVSGAIFGETINPVTKEKRPPNEAGSISIFSAVCAVLSVMIIAVGAYKYLNNIVYALISSITALCGYAVFVFGGALVQSKSGAKIQPSALNSEDEAQAQAPEPPPTADGENPPETAAFDYFQMVLISVLVAAVAALVIGLFLKNA